MEDEVVEYGFAAELGFTKYGTWELNEIDESITPSPNTYLRLVFMIQDDLNDLDELYL